jgi:site-specific recombinase XerD
MPRRKHPVPVLSLDACLDSWLRALVAQNRSKQTVKSYRNSVTQLGRHLEARGVALVPARLSRDDIEAFMSDFLARCKPSSAATRFSGLWAFFAWLVTEGELKTSPMEGMKCPHVPEQPIPVLPIDDVRRILRVCAGTTYFDRRDTAIIRLLYDTGLRVGELVGIQLADLDLNEMLVAVHGKGGRKRYQPFGTRATRDLDRYLRARKSRPDAQLSSLWLGLLGPLTTAGVRQMLQARARAAGIDRRVWPHLMRHAFVDSFLSSGGNDSDVVRLAGWRSAKMLDRYGVARADVRAREAHRRLSPGDAL